MDTPHWEWRYATPRSSLGHWFDLILKNTHCLSLKGHHMTWSFISCNNIQCLAYLYCGKSNHKSQLGDASWMVYLMKCGCLKMWRSPSQHGCFNTNSYSNDLDVNYRTPNHQETKGNLIKNEHQLVDGLSLVSPYQIPTSIPHRIPGIIINPHVSHVFHW